MWRRWWLAVSPMVEFDVRWSLAEFYAGGFPDVVVVGDYPDSWFGARDWHVPSVRDVPGFWRRFRPQGPYAVVALNFQLRGGQAEADAMVGLCDGADRLIIEWATEAEHLVFPPSMLVNKRRRMAEILLDLTVVKPSDYGVKALRTFQVWR